MADVVGQVAPGQGRPDAWISERFLTPLERALRDRIRTEGPVSVEAWMEACNAFYYATRDPLGATGDFTTAPEISQMFGELVGGALADCWIRAGKPANAVYAELGPGRGTLAADALRLLRRAGFAGEVHLVETSPTLRERQRRSVPEAKFHDDLSTLPVAPLLLAANEFLDALPIRQFVNGIERKVTIAAGGLAFDRDGEIVENSPVRDDAVSALSAHLAGHGGVAIVIDYGHSRSTPGDTLQAVRRHGFAPLLANPGDQDLTAHVDFEAVAKAAKSAGADVTPLVTMGEWLERLGIAARAEALARAHPDKLQDIKGSVHRLCDPDEMGRLFKVMAIHSAQWPAPLGFQ